MIRTLRQRRRGQAIVEMAILFPLFLLVVFGGIIDFGFAFYNLLTLQQMADDAAQWGAEHTTGPADNPILNTSGINTRLTQSRPTWWVAANFTSTIGNPTPMASPFNTHFTTQITLRYNSPTYTPLYQTLLGMAGSPNIPLAAQATYKIPRNLVNR